MTVASNGKGSKSSEQTHEHKSSLIPQTYEKPKLKTRFQPPIQIIKMAHSFEFLDHLKHYEKKGHHELMRQTCFFR